MAVISVSMPESLIGDLDEFIDDHGYSGRSEAIRTGTREMLGEFDHGDHDGEVVAVVTTMFDHGSGVETALSALRHDHEELVTANVHSHAGEACLELFVVEGGIDEIGSYVGRLRTVGGLTAVEYSILASEGSPLA